MLPVNCGSHTDYQHFVVTNLRKYYPDTDALARSTWDIIERFWNLDKVLLDSAHDAMPYYQYFKRENITPFIDLNGKGGRPPVYKNDFTIDKDGVPISLFPELRYC